MIPLNSDESNLVEFALRMGGNVVHELVKQTLSAEMP